MAIDKEKLARKGWGLLVSAAVCALIGLVVARVACELGPSWGTPEFQYAATNMVSNILAAPFSIDWEIPSAKWGMLLGFAVPMAIILKSALEGMKLDNEDTMHAHGDSRLATEKEMKELTDSRRFANTRWISAHCGLPAVPMDEHTKSVLDGRNLNQVCYGISGLGKTFNGVWPDKMGAVGEWLPAMEYGRKNAVDKLLHRSSLPEQFRAGVDGDNIDAFRGWCASQAADLKAKRDAQAARTPESLRKKLGAGAFVDGYDVFCTDPKGDDLRELGWMFEAAGAKIKSLDVNSLASKSGSYVGTKYNPLARIQERWVDCKDAAEVEVGFGFSAKSRKRDYPEVPGKLKGQEDAPSLDLSAGPIGTRAVMTLHTDTLTWEKVSKSPKYYELMEQAAQLKAKGKSTQAAVIEKQARDLYDKAGFVEQWTVPVAPRDGARFAPGERRSADAGGVGLEREQAGASRTAARDIVEGYSYKQTSGEIVLEMANNTPDMMREMECSFELDPGLEMLTFEANGGEIIWPTNEDGQPTARGRIVWRVSNVPGKPADDDAPIWALTLKVRMRTFRVPDSVTLTKVVNTLVTNLGGDAAANNKSDDPFWDDTKRLCFMSLIAWLFERYEDPKYRTIPEMLNFLDLVIKNREPKAKSQMDALIEEWQTGVRRVAAEPVRVPGRRGVTGGWRDEPIPEGPHSSDRSLAVACYNAFRTAADDTVLSIVISCQAAIVNLRSQKVLDMLSADEMELSTLGDAGQRQIIFCIVPDTVSPYDFITALVVEEAIDVLMTKAANDYGGKLPRHVRFILDEVANIGKLPSLERAIAVVRSRNVSLSLFLQSKSQLEANYGKETASTIENNCTTVVFLGSQSNEMLKEMSDRVGNETVFSRVMQRSFNQGTIAGSTSESISSSERAVMSPSQIAHLEKGKLLAFVFNAPGAILDDKFPTSKHPLYAYVSPGRERSAMQPPAVFREEFKFSEYMERERAREIEAARAAEAA